MFLNFALFIGLGVVAVLVVMVVAALLTGKGKK